MGKQVTMVNGEVVDADVCPNCGEPFDDVVPKTKRVEGEYERYCQVGTAANEHAGRRFVHR